MGDPITVLIVDDHRKIRRGITAILAFADEIHIVGEASNGVEALFLIKQELPHVVLLDLQIPVLDGFQTTRTIKRAWPEVKVIALSALPDYRGDAIAAGVDYFIVKGDPNESIIEAIHMVMHSRLSAGSHYFEQLKE